MFPTRVGVNRHSRSHWCGPLCAPHACGGEPSADWLWAMLSVPHACGGEPRRSPMWRIRVHVFPTRVGVNRLAEARKAYNVVLPTRVGVNRSPESIYPQEPSIPHACGGEPSGKTRAFTPLSAPTRVGVTLASLGLQSDLRRSPRVRGEQNRRYRRRLGSWIPALPHACGGEPPAGCRTVSRWN